MELSIMHQPHSRAVGHLPLTLPLSVVGALIFAVLGGCLAGYVGSIVFKKREKRQRYATHRNIASMDFEKSCLNTFSA